jgi:hypothetical protein
MRRSIAFQVATLHRSVKGWYFKYKMATLEKNIRQAAAKTRAITGSLTFLTARIKTQRFYVEKQNGKLRPIGAPDKASKMHLAQLAFFIT